MNAPMRSPDPPATPLARDLRGRVAPKQSFVDKKLGNLEVLDLDRHRDQAVALPAPIGTLARRSAKGIMASGHVNRVNRPNTWLHRPMLQTFKKVLANSEPSTHGGKADIAGFWPGDTANDPKQTSCVRHGRKYSRSC
jgi:hypothetical protein